MSSEVQFAVSTIVENNYVTLVIVTAVIYDYILSFADEIEYVWNKPWTRVSTLFVFIRYSGLCIIIIYALIGSTFLPGPAKIDWLTPLNSCQILYIVGQWATTIFVATADLAMILRIWAIYMQSRIVLGVLLTLYMVQIVAFVIESVLVSARLRGNTARVLDYLFCMTENNVPTIAKVADCSEFLLAAAMFALVVTNFIQHTLEVYKATKKWQPGHYMNLFAKESILYFFAVLLFATIDILFLGVKMPIKGWRALALAIVQYVPVFTLTPRFILSVRALYARDLNRRIGPLDMDTQFGFASVQARGAGGITLHAVSAGQGEGGLSLERAMEEGHIQSVGNGV